MQQPKTFDEAVCYIIGELQALLITKQHDYGHQNILDFGELGLLVRANDKITRLKNLINKEPENEPKIDSWRDLAGYSILALMLNRGWFELPLEK